jgi:hypothetical protein
MPRFQLVRPCRQSQVSSASVVNDLGPSGSHVARTLAAISAALLVVASAGFGCHFAFTQGVHHGPALAGFAVAMALGLELAKPFSVEAAFACFRAWAIGRGLAMTALGLVAVAYSLTAELSLMAATRADGAAQRTKAADATTDDRAELARLVAERSSMVAFAQATAETVTAAREAVVAAEVTRAAECSSKRSPRCRAREADEAAARASLAKAIGDKATTDRAAKLDADAAKVRTRLAAAGDPGASALANYLRSLGLDIPAALLSEWLVLVGVLALEIGSALAVVLVRAAAPAATRPVVEQSADDRAEAQAAEPQRPSTEAVTGGKASKRTRTRRKVDQPCVDQGGPADGGPAARGPRARVMGDIVDQLRRRGGELSGASERAVAKLIGQPRSTTRRALHGLLAAGIVTKVAGGALVLAAW